MRNALAKLVRTRARELEIPVRKPPRYGHAKHMSVAVYDAPFPVTDDDGLADPERTADDLRRVQRLVDVEFTEK
jgi:hypothetical protein